MTRFVVVTGTDTGVGKTFVTEALARLLSRTRRVVAIKPFESGVTDAPGDGERLAAATGQTAPLHALVRLKEPLTPALAADREGVAIDFDGIVEAIRKHARGADVVLIEGAGGLLSPLTWDRDIVDLARQIETADEGVSAIIVGPDRLGAIGSTLAVEALLSQSGLSRIAIVTSASGDRDASSGTNAAAIRRRLARMGKERAVVELACVDVSAAEDALATLAGWVVA